jgi:hypothetical protein
MSVIDGGNGEERKKGRKVGMERQRRSRKGMMSLLRMAGRWKGGERKKERQGWKGRA